MSHNAYLHLTFPTFYKCTHGCVQFKHTTCLCKKIETEKTRWESKTNYLMNKMLPPKCPPNHFLDHTALVTEKFHVIGKYFHILCIKKEMRSYALQIYTMKLLWKRATCKNYIEFICSVVCISETQQKFSNPYVHNRVSA